MQDPRQSQVFQATGQVSCTLTSFPNFARPFQLAKDLQALEPTMSPKSDAKLLSCSSKNEPNPHLSHGLDWQLATCTDSFEDYT